MPKHIEKIFVGCYLKDSWLANICIASIRHWYPDVEIELIKDQRLGDFDTSTLERTYNVSLAKTPPLVGAFGRLEICFQKTACRFLYLDADIVMGGRVLDSLANYESDFLVSSDNYDSPDTDHFKSNYYDLAGVQRIAPKFRFPGSAFNSGQFVGTSGILTREDFTECVTWGAPPEIRVPETFKMNDQGPFNYVLESKSQAGRLSLEHLDFKRNALDPRLGSALLSDILSGDGLPHVIHWIGPKPDAIQKFTHSDVLEYFQDKFLTDAGVSGTSAAVGRLRNLTKLKLLSAVRRAYSYLPGSVKETLRSIRAKRR